MHVDEMILVATRLWPDAEVHEQDGVLVIDTGIRSDEQPSENFAADLTIYAERLNDGVIEHDNAGQRVIYTGYTDPGYADPS